MVKVVSLKPEKLICDVKVLLTFFFIKKKQKKNFILATSVHHRLFLCFRLLALS